MSATTVVAVAAGLVLLAVPLYLWSQVRPVPPAAVGDDEPALEDGPVAGLEPLDGGLLRGALPSIDALEQAAERASVKLSPFQTIRCVKRGPGRTPPERCDHVEELEQALEEAIRNNVALGPARPKGATVSFVMDVDFNAKRLEIYRGKSSTVPKGETEELFRRVKRAVPPPRWDEDGGRDHYRYIVYVMATYPPTETF